MADLIDPRIARAVARRLAGDDSFKASYLMDRLRGDLEVAVPRSEQLVAEVAGIPAPAPVEWSVIDRSAWAEANIAGMKRLLAPMTERFGRRLADAPFALRLAQRTLVSVEVGALLGYVSRRVLGQFDMLVPKETAGSGGVLYFVGPNIVETERRYGFVPEEFVLWVALHEVTHRFQFDGVPWLRDRFFGLVDTYLATMDGDARGLASRLSGAVKRLVQKSVPSDEKNPVYLLASDDQKVVLDDIQALMAVVEGHGNFVMDAIGSRTIPSFGRMRWIFERRRAQTNAAQRALNHVIGLEMKLRQYELGRSFCEAVFAAGGWDALAGLWESPERFPSLQEIREPQRWLQRVA